MESEIKGRRWWPSLIFLIAWTLVRGARRSPEASPEFSSKDVRKGERRLRWRARGCGATFGVLLTGAGGLWLSQAARPSLNTSGALIIWIDDRIPKGDTFIDIREARDPVLSYDIPGGLGVSEPRSDVIYESGKFKEVDGGGYHCDAGGCHRTVSDARWHRASEEMGKILIHIEGPAGNIVDGDDPPSIFVFDNGHHVLADLALGNHLQDGCPGMPAPILGTAIDQSGAPSGIATTIGCTEGGKWYINVEAGLRQPIIAKSRGRITGSLPGIAVERVHLPCPNHELAPTDDSCEFQDVTPAPFTVQADLQDVSTPRILPNYVETQVSPAPSRANSLRWSLNGDGPILDQLLQPEWSATNLDVANRSNRLDQLATVAIAIGASLTVAAVFRFSGAPR